MSLKRKLNPMPDFVREAIEAKGLMGRFRQRPAYQQNDYLGWISKARLEETRLRRLEQMLDELRRGDGYMNMRWNGPPDG